MNICKIFAIGISFVIYCSGQNQECKHSYVNRISNENLNCRSTLIQIPNTKQKEFDRKLSIESRNLLLLSTTLSFIRENEGSLLFMLNPACENPDIFKLYINGNLICEDKSINKIGEGSMLEVTFNYYEYNKHVAILHLNRQKFNSDSNIKNVQTTIDDKYDSDFFTLAQKQSTFDTCGVANKNSQLILKGKSVKLGEYPWVAALLLEEDMKIICTATIVSEEHVLTAAHCLENREPSELRILYGAVDMGDRSGLLMDDDPLAEILNITIHHQYIPKTANYDIGILKTTPMRFSNNANKICLPLKNSERKNGIVAGWGETKSSNGNAATVLQKIDMPIVELKDCLYENEEIVTLTKNHSSFCAGKLDGSGPCLGDSGAPMFKRIGNIYYLEGIVSTAIKKDGHCDLGRYIILTDVSKVLGWIKSKMNG